MVAYFSSKLIKRLQAATALGLLVICLLGTHWVGLQHGISHAPSSIQSIELGGTDQDTLLQHGSASCHLFDALALASFLVPHADLIQQEIERQDFYLAINYSHLQTNSRKLYQSRAPPSFII